MYSKWHVLYISFIEWLWRSIKNVFNLLLCVLLVHSRASKLGGGGGDGAVRGRFPLRYCIKTKLYSKMLLKIFNNFFGVFVLKMVGEHSNIFVIIKWRTDSRRCILKRSILFFLRHFSYVYMFDIDVRDFFFNVLQFYSSYFLCT